VKRVALLALLLVACSSGSDLIDSETIDCAESGNEVSVMLGGVNIEMSPSTLVSTPNPPVTIQVEVSNNSHNDIVVKSISLRPRDERTGGRFRLNPAAGRFDQTIEEGKEHVFTLQTTGRWRESINDLPGETPSGAVEVEARVALANGQTYRCVFALPVGG
jgi:hypothetical protein